MIGSRRTTTKKEDFKLLWIKIPLITYNNFSLLSWQKINQGRDNITAKWSEIQDS